MTASISSAPARSAASISFLTFAALVPPAGKLTTVAMRMLLPLRCRAASPIHCGQMHTAAGSPRGVRARRQRSAISAAVQRSLRLVRSRSEIARLAVRARLTMEEAFEELDHLRRRLGTLGLGVGMGRRGAFHAGA